MPSSDQGPEDLGEPMEQTPLLGMSVERPTESRQLKSWASMAILALVLITGGFIGIYLLIIQGESESIIPPMTPGTTIKAVEYYETNDFFADPKFRPSTVVIKAGVTRECYGLVDCLRVLADMEDRGLRIDDLIPFNILSMCDGMFMLHQRWQDDFDLDPDTFVISMMGNFSNERLPIVEQVNSVTNFIIYHSRLGHFGSQFVVMLNQNTNNNLIQAFKKVPNFCAKCNP